MPIEYGFLSKLKNKGKQLTFAIFTPNKSESRSNFEIKKRGDSSLEDISTKIPGFADKQRELLHWHRRTGHTAFRNLQVLAKAGCIPKYLENVPPPKCLACIFGKSHRRPWRTKEKHLHKI